MPSRGQLGPRGSVWRGLEAVKVPSGSKSLNFHVFGRRGNSPSSCLILQSGNQSFGFIAESGVLEFDWTCPIEPFQRLPRYSPESEL